MDDSISTLYCVFESVESTRYRSPSSCNTVENVIVHTHSCKSMFLRNRLPEHVLWNRQYFAPWYADHPLPFLRLQLWKWVALSSFIKHIHFHWQKNLSEVITPSLYTVTYQGFVFSLLWKLHVSKVCIYIMFSEVPVDRWLYYLSTSMLVSVSLCSKACWQVPTFLSTWKKPCKYLHCTV